eukprot:13954-Heterococcus_DN1.PRE.3
MSPRCARIALQLHQQNHCCIYEILSFNDDTLCRISLSEHSAVTLINMLSSIAVLVGSAITNNHTVQIKYTAVQNLVKLSIQGSQNNATNAQEVRYDVDLACVQSMYMLSRTTRATVPHTDSTGRMCTTNARNCKPAPSLCIYTAASASCMS